MLRITLRFLALLMLCNLAGAATPPADDAVLPTILRDWRSWVLKDLDFRACPFLSTQMSDDANGRICAWPGRLSLDAAAGGATFALHWRVDAPSWVTLPGDAQHWPQQVKVNGQAQPVLDRAGTPALWLTAGGYDIAGTIPWHERPQSLPVPSGIGLIALSVDGKAVAPVQRDGDAVTLGRSAAAAPEADSVDLRVFRELADGVPALLTTQIHFIVAGQAREETFGPVLPPGFVATALTGNWPARLDNDGRLHVQVQPGEAVLSLSARALAPLAEVAAHLPAAPWPKQEVWSYAAAPRLRVTNAAAQVSVDPQQAQVPAEWQALPAFALADGDKITIEQRSRGLSPGEANRLSLRREAWLDFAGSGWYARDAIDGSMVQGWRLDVAAPFKLERAEASTMARTGTNTGEALLVTRGANETLSGVEWRTPNVHLAGSVRIDAVSDLPATGWQQSFDRIDTTLHFPYAYKLLGAPGADRVQGSWMSCWSLLDVFVAAIVALLAWRLLGVFGALVAVGYLALGYQESGSPLWTLIALLALALIMRVLPAGKLQVAALWLRRAAMLAFVLVALPFAADQVRYALYPQLEAGQGAWTYYAARKDGPYLDNGAPVRDEVEAAPAQTMAIPPPPAAPAPPPPPMLAKPKLHRTVPMPTVAGAAKVAEPDADKKELESVTVTGNVVRKSDLIDHYSQSTVMQTGAGEPSWQVGSTAHLSWSGPVTPAQSVRLVVAPPWLVRPLRIVLALLLAWLAWSSWRGRPAALLPARMGAAGLAGVLLATSLAFVPHAQAQGIPSDELLEQLRERLTEAPKCAPACAGIAQMQVIASGDALNVVLEAHAGERLALPLPRIDANATLKSIKVDTVADVPVARLADGSAWIALDRGVHRVEVAYAVHADRLALNFVLVPARVLFSGSGWSASGIEDERLLGGSLSLARTRDDAGAGAKPELGAQQFPPYVRVVRSLMLGLDWSVQTQVQRISPAVGGVAVTLPVLAGEHVSTPGIKVQNSTATVAIADGAAETSWNGALDKADTLTLVAPALADCAEVWRVLVSPTWHAEFSGVPVVGLAAGEEADDYRNFEFHPLPGETLTVKVTRPAAAAGATRAIDAVSLVTDIGQRSASHVLGFTLRASQGGEQAIMLPKGAEVTAVQRDNESLNLRAQDGKLTLPVKPGMQRYQVSFRDDAALGFVVRTPQVGLGLPAANIELIARVPADRWLLATSGPAVGPAVLYWGELAVMVAVAWALARTRRTKLKFRDWLLLGLGFSTSSWLAPIVFAAWLFAFDWRGRCETKDPWWRFDLVQIGLAVLTVVALVALVSTIKLGLLGAPDMHVVGNSSSATSLNWFADRAADALPQASAFSLPIWLYKVLMLAWALWLANALIGWLREAWMAWTRGGYWQPRPEAQRAPPAGTAQTTDAEKT